MAYTKDQHLESPNQFSEDFPGLLFGQQQRWRTENQCLFNVQPAVAGGPTCVMPEKTTGLLFTVEL